ncbi:protein DOWNSTREAM OF FLC-like [Cornus florida]|uniref:protein DOWNSTREAM OF FLC-like n=1 Tax=Cornus florida TaxID=4283 RepID=UPI00289E691A|nr:protein DOWNSTREAM OF FLC-like [Cornus florida]
MSRLILLLALCVLPALVSARFVGNPFLVRGKVYCDTCCAGFETDKTPYIAGATVRIECKDRKTEDLKYSIEGVTSSAGIYNIEVSGDRGDDVCDVKVVSSPQSDCATPSSGRDRARVILTRYNGIVPDIRNVNSIGFQRNEPMAGCTELLKKYMVDEDE